MVLHLARLCSTPTCWPHKRRLSPCLLSRASDLRGVARPTTCVHGIMLIGDCRSRPRTLFPSLAKFIHACADMNLPLPPTMEDHLSRCGWMRLMALVTASAVISSSLGVSTAPSDIDATAGAVPAPTVPTPAKVVLLPVSFDTS